MNLTPEEFVALHGFFMAQSQLCQAIDAMVRSGGAEPTGAAKTPRANGTTHVVFTPHSFLTRLSWLIVKPGMHLTRYHGVLAPNHPWRNILVPKPPVRVPGTIRCKRSGLDWATLLKRVFALEVLVCASCGGQRRVIAEIPEGKVATAILAHLHLPTTAPKPRQSGLFQTGPPDEPEPEAPPAWSEQDYAQPLPDYFESP